MGESAESRLRRNPFVPERRILLASRHDVEKYLYEFLQLKAGQEWAVTDLLNWKSEDGLARGDTLHARLRTFGSSFEHSLAEICSSPKLSAALGKTSFRPRQHMTNIDQCREHLRRFLAFLPEDETWSPRKLQEWPGVDGGPAGSTVFSWINRNEGCLDRDFLGRLLGEDAPTLLLRNPFTRRERIISSPSDAKNCLTAFLGTLEDGSWSIGQLAVWDAEGWNGWNLLCWLRRHYGGSTSQNITAVLGDDANILVRKPLKGREQILALRQTHLLNFLATLPPGQSWSPSTLETHERALYRWILANIRHEDEVDWLYVLVKLIPADILVQHPFRRFGRSILSSSTHVNRSASGPFTTSTEEVDWGRFAATEGSDPEQELIALETGQEEDGMIEGLRSVISLLSEDEKRLVEDFYADRPVDEDQFSSVLAKLREFLGVIEDL